MKNSQRRFGADFDKNSKYSIGFLNRTFFQAWRLQIYKLGPGTTTCRPYKHWFRAGIELATHSETVGPSTTTPFLTCSFGFSHPRPVGKFTLYLISNNPLLFSLLVPGTHTSSLLEMYELYNPPRGVSTVW